jgi:hypothetical protein
MRRLVLVLQSVVVLVGMMAAPANAAAATTCLGKPVTIVASATVTTGTDSDDVVAMTPSGWSSFDALGGNDTICLALGTATGGTKPMPATGYLDAGSGDDIVVNQSAASPGAAMHIGLGAGDDTFTGNDINELIFADSSLQTFDAPVLSGTQRDVVSTGGGADMVWTAAPLEGLNADHITFGAGTAQISYLGAMSPQGVLDVSAASFASLQLPQPGAAEPTARGELLVDNETRRATVGGAQVLTWTGEIRSFQFGRDAATSSRLPVSFTGSGADESVTILGGPVGDIRLAGGDDGLWVQAYNGPFVPRSADGGPGENTAAIETNCLLLTVIVDRGSSCDGTTGPFTGFSEVIATSNLGRSRVSLVGTDAGERLVANGDSVTVRARGGRDNILVDEGWTTRVLGGPGGDRIVARGDDVVVRGQAGADRILLVGPPGYNLFDGADVEMRQQVALGGSGADILSGTSIGRGDRLVGGAGHDRANGRAGKHDFCLAEATRHCEQP